MEHARDMSQCVTLPDGRIMVIGGKEAEDAVLTSTEFLDLRSGKWSEGPSMKSKRWGHSAVLLPNSDRVLAMGGWDGTGGSLDLLALPVTECFSSSTEIFEVRADRWEPCVSLLDPCAFGASCIFGDQVLLLGGRSSPVNIQAVVQGLEITPGLSQGALAPGTLHWGRCALNLPLEMQGFGVAACGEELYIYGGMDRRSRCFRHVYHWVADRGRWVAQRKMHQDRAEFAFGSF
jgi:hypothetical protein